MKHFDNPILVTRPYLPDLPTYYGLPLSDVRAIARDVLEIIKS